MNMFIVLSKDVKVEEVNDLLESKVVVVVSIHIFYTTRKSSSGNFLRVVMNSLDTVPL